MRILVIGGRGNFGVRICRALAEDPELEVIAAGRSTQRNSGELSRYGVADSRLDLASADFAQQLRAFAPAIVVHCAGPFQGQDYRVAEASINAGSHYIDIADARAFVVGFADALHARATAADVLAITGASSVPALTSAVLDAMRTRLQQIEEIQICIAPAQQAPRGAATIGGVFSYAGRPFDCWKDERWQIVHGWQSMRRVDFRFMGARLATVCDVPDLALFPHRYPGVRTVEFRAALELRLQHYALWTCAALRRLGIPLPLERWARPLDRLAGALNRFGSKRGGMLVTVTGRSADNARTRIDWELSAPDNHGPEIPCMAARLIARKLKRGSMAMRGALPCVGLLALDDFAAEFTRWNISTRIDETTLT